MTIAIPQPFAAITPRHLEAVAALAESDIDDEPLAAVDQSPWAGLTALGTELWLDTGDIEAASAIWSPRFAALTTNNSLLNAEIQKGIYDELVPRAAAVVSDLPPPLQVLEIGFLLNAHHGLRLVRRFAARVSVELSTELADDVDGSVFYGRRFAAISPRFIVKIPMTPSGLLAARTLAAEGIPVNFTLGFSARQNHLAAGFAKPTWVNVFLGRIGAYLADNGLGDGAGSGEKAHLASQRAVRDLATGTHQIAASMRSGSQVAALAGGDVFTMPVKVAQAVREDPPATWVDRSADDPAVDSPAAVRPETLWAITEADRSLLASLEADPPATAEALIDRVHGHGLGDMFPRLNDQDRQIIVADGKIPRHERWAERIASGELAVDTLLRLAALGAFSTDQRQLDDRIRSLLG